MQTHCSVSSYRIDLYFHNYKLATEIVENGLSNRNSDNNKKFVVGLLRLILSRKALFFDTINEIFRQIKQLLNQLILIINSITCFGSYCLCILLTRELKIKHKIQNTR